MTKFFQDPLDFAVQYSVYLILVGLALSLMLDVTREMLFSLLTR